MNSDFIPAWWLPSPHLQTLWPFFFRKRRRLDIRHEQLELDDGDFLDLCWSRRQHGELVLLVHGLEGSIQSHYAAGMFHTLEVQGYRPVLMHFRGCSGRDNRLDRAYHSGDTADIAAVVAHIASATNSRVYAAIGFSLGANALLKWLGETGTDNPLAKAVAVSVPFKLHDAAKRLDQGFSRFYQQYLLRQLRSKMMHKFTGKPSPIKVDVRKLKSFWDYDEHVTAPLHGFKGVDHYYTESSSHQYLKEIRIPTQIIHAVDDPFMFASSAPTADEVSCSVERVLCQRGGHIGFVSGKIPFRAQYWHESKIIDFLAR